RARTPGAGRQKMGRPAPPSSRERGRSLAGWHAEASGERGLWALLSSPDPAQTYRMRDDLEVINRTVEKTYDWIGRVSDGAGFSFEDPHRAYQALKAVLHALRDRLPLE